MRCPKCGSPMDRAESNVGLDIRRQFLICSLFPKCDGRLDRIPRRRPSNKPNSNPGIIIQHRPKFPTQRKFRSHKFKFLMFASVGLFLMISLIGLSNNFTLFNPTESNNQTPPQITPSPTFAPSPSPTSISPLQPSAICRDGTYSFNRNRRGICSHHGGVSQWVISNQNTIPLESENSIPAIVTRVVEGDTIDVLLDGEIKDRIRLLGVDTPETFIPNQPNEYGNITDLDCLDKWGDKATAFSERHLGVETSVILHFDGDKKEDVYGRTLAYIHLPDDLDFNKGLIRNGLARVYEKGSSHRELDYKNSQVLAIEAEVGLWQCGNE